LMPQLKIASSFPIIIYYPVLFFSLAFTTSWHIFIYWLSSLPHLEYKPHKKREFIYFLHLFIPNTWCKACKKVLAEWMILMNKLSTSTKLNTTYNLEVEVQRKTCQTRRALTRWMMLDNLFRLCGIFCFLICKMRCLY
jgi:hypothetical protein